jgi:hypothetical protein
MTQIRLGYLLPSNSRSPLPIPLVLGKLASRVKGNVAQKQNYSAFPAKMSYQKHPALGNAIPLANLCFLTLVY